MAYLLEGRSLAVPPFSADQLVPTLNLGTLPFVATVVLLCAGMEMAGYHASSVPNPQKDYPRAMALSATIISVLLINHSQSILLVAS
jgi:amino acid transporter